MGKLSHLLAEEPNNTFAIDFSNVSEEIILQVAEMVAYQTREQFSPTVKLLEEYASKVQQESMTAVQDALKELKTIEGKVDSSMKSELAKVEKSISRTADAVKASSKGSEQIRESLISALSRITIPDYSNVLERIEAGQRQANMMIEALAAEELDDEEDPKEWEFDVQRNRNGFIQSVTAKAK